MTADQLRRLLRALVVVAVAVVPVVFWRAIDNAFDLTKATVLVALGLVIAVVVAWLAVLEPRRLAPPSILVTAGVFVAAVIVATVSSQNPMMSLVGQPNRFTGAVVVIGCVAVMLAIAAAYGSASAPVLGRVIVVVMAVVGGYGIVQHLGLDPFVWSTETFGKEAFSTVGNPNTAAGVTAIGLPFVIWTMFDTGLDRRWRLGAGAVVGVALGALVAFGSFQGPVAALVSVGYLALWAVARGRALGRVGGVAVVALAAAVPIAAVAVVPRRAATFAVVVFVVYYVALVFVLPRLERLEAPAVLRARWRTVVGVALGVVALVAVIAGPGVARIVADEVAQGLDERTAFYGAALGSFADTPVFGDGFETFVLVFPEYRPQWHAERLEMSRTASVHSVGLAMFQSGGVVLGGAWLALAAAVIVVGVRGLRREVVAGGGVLAAAVVAFVASLVQGLVSVEHVALYLWQFVAAGLVVAVAAEGAGREGPGREGASREGAGQPRPGQRGPGRPGTGRRRPIVRTVPLVAVGGTLVVAVGVMALVGLRPIRAELAERRAAEAIAAQVAGPAVEGIADAVALAPWELRFRIQQAALLDSLGEARAAAEVAEALLERAHGSIFALPSVRFVVAEATARLDRGDTAGVGADLERAADRVVRLQANDPLAPEAARLAAELLEEIATGFERLGDPGSAAATRQRLPTP